MSTSVPCGKYTFLKERDQLESLIERYDSFLFDCDGVLWSGTDALPGVASVLDKLRSRKKHIMFVTNNASKSRRVLLDRFAQLGIHADLSEVVSSASATALYLKEVLKLPEDRKAYVVGMPGIEEELDGVGIKHLGGSDPQDHVHFEGTDFGPLLQEGSLDPTVGAVVCGIDTKLTYLKLAKAFRYLTRPGAEGEPKAGEKDGGCYFVASNADVTFPSKAGPWPGAGSCWAGLRDATGRKPTVVGKPEQPMLDTIFAAAHFDRSRTLMVGDRLNTDIAFGAKGGADTLLVLTGISSLDDVHAKNAPAVPTYVMNGLGDLDVL